MHAFEMLPMKAQTAVSFFDRPQVKVEEIPVGPGVPLGIEKVANPTLGIGGAYGTWGQCYDNATLPAVVEEMLGHPLNDKEKMDLSELGFECRHHVPELTQAEHVQLEVEVGSRLVRAAADANGWEPGEVDAVLIGSSVPVVPDFTERVASAAGIPEDALKVNIHKACDGSVAGLNLALNPGLATNGHLIPNLAERLYGKKVLVGGIEGLTRVMKASRDRRSLQLFGTGGGIIGLIPGRTMKFLVGGMHEVYDEEGLLQVRMLYPHSRQRDKEHSMIEITEPGKNAIRIAGLMHEPEDESVPVSMAGMALVKLFVRHGAEVVQNVYQAYKTLMSQAGTPGKGIAVAVVHHANLKINQLKARTLQEQGITIPMPWLVSDFGNVSAASNMIAFLRCLMRLKPGDHVLFDGFGAGTYYDVIAVELGDQAKPAQS